MPYNILDAPRGPSAFTYRDPEGAPGLDGVRRHGALDWFSRGGSPVYAPVAGEVVEARASRGTTGQVFGGTVKVRERSTGRVYVMRHVEPQVSVGQDVRAGQQVATVTPWRDGPPHVHLEVWRTLAGGYRLPNMVDPGALTWLDRPKQTHAAVPDDGRYLRIVVDGGRIDVSGWDAALGALTHIARNGIKTNRVALAWRGPGSKVTGVWRGARDVTAVARSIYRRFVAS